MKLGMIGLGRMGANMVQRLLNAGHECVVFDLSKDNIKSMEDKGAIGSQTLEDFVAKLEKPRTVWIMVPSGKPTEDAINEVAELLDDGDTVVDGGNSHYKDDVRRAKELGARGIDFVDAGTSGGIWGVERGYCLMYGGKKNVVDRLEPIFKSLAPGKGSIEKTPGRDKVESTAEEGYLHCGPVGSGHYVKMVHNGIEYGLMQAFAEGFHIFKKANNKDLPEDIQYDLDLPEIAEVWRRGSVVSSWLLDLAAASLIEDPELSKFTGSVADSGEGRWTIEAAVEQGVSAEVLSAALYARFRSRQDNTFAEKILSAMRKQFGGHKEAEKE